MSEFLRSYLTAGLAGVAAVVMAGALLLAGRVIRPRRPNAAKSQAYESGVRPSGARWDQSYLRYYLYALLFVVFDIEVAFIIPWAVQVVDLGLFGLVEMGVFIAVLALGIAYAWRKRVLTWD